jgi:hypothetical protein
MSRPARAFTAESFELEGRLLLAVARASTFPPPPTVQFESATSLPNYTGVGEAIEVVTQQAGEATVTLSRSDTAGSLQVQVQTSSSPYVGAVDPTVTFADGQSQATLTVPILAGAPNPGAVDVYLSLSYIDPLTHQPNTYGDVGDPTLDLKIVASDPTLPPKVVFKEATVQGILLGFNKPMNPAAASDVNNYTVTYKHTVYPSASSNLFKVIFSNAKDSTYVKLVRLQSAQYDPTTQSVILIPKQPIPSGLFTTLTQVHTARTSGRRGHRSKFAGSLTDLQGTPINARTTPGKIELRDALAPPIAGGSL